MGCNCKKNITQAPKKLTRDARPSSPRTKRIIQRVIK